MVLVTGNASLDLYGISHVPDIFLVFPLAEHNSFVEVLFKITLQVLGLKLKLISFIFICKVVFWLPINNVSKHKNLNIQPY